MEVGMEVKMVMDKEEEEHQSVMEENDDLLDFPL